MNVANIRKSYNMKQKKYFIAYGHHYMHIRDALIAATITSDKPVTSVLAISSELEVREYITG
jgi:nitrous oxidase accessory protein NosD